MLTIPEASPSTIPPRLREIFLTAIVTDPDCATGIISYHWKRDGADISGATSSAYTTVQADVGTAISVTATYTDNLGSVRKPHQCRNQSGHCKRCSLVDYGRRCQCRRPTRHRVPGKQGDLLQLNDPEPGLCSVDDERHLFNGIRY